MISYSVRRGVAKGGWRCGAGRPGWKRKAESSLPLDIRRLAKSGVLHARARFAWQWTNGYGKKVGNIGILYEPSPERMTLNYQWTPYGEEPRNVTCPVHIDRTSCQYGGTRPWFLCPRCWRRSAVLYFGGSGFACRRCLRVAYACQSEDEMGRLWRKRRKVERRLAEGGDEWNGWQKPKGMHRSTFERAVSRLHEIQAEQDQVFSMAAARLLGGAMNGLGPKMPT